ncbi:MAG: spermidine synthase [Candidatus Eremiobacteraeota bacterium]|nr:spermidine synthase [Candidatus Eremiobacteraeota bacterium]
MLSPGLNLEAPLTSKKSGCHQFYVEWQSPDSAHFHGVGKTVYSGKSPYQTIEIYQTLKFGKLLVLDGDPQSSEQDEDIYHEVLVHPALVTCSDHGAVLILGGGEGATLRETLRHKSVQKAVMVDIDELVVQVSKEFLPTYSSGCFDDPRSMLLIQDAKVFLEKTVEQFDCVISDLTEPYPDTPTQALLSEGFFRLIKSKMKPGGVFAMQASHSGRGMHHLHRSYVGMLKKIWKIVRPYHAFIPSFYSDWGFILCSDLLDPLKVSAEQVNGKVSSFSKDLRYYDGAIHQALFTLPKEFRS